MASRCFLLILAAGLLLDGREAFAGGGIVIYKDHSFDSDSQAEIAGYNSVERFSVVDNVITTDGQTLRIVSAQEPIYIPQPGDPDTTPAQAAGAIRAAERRFPQFTRDLEMLRRAWAALPKAAPSIAARRPQAPQAPQAPTLAPVPGNLLRTRSGEVFQAWSISSIEGDTVVINHSAGISRVPVTELPDALIDGNPQLKQVWVAEQARLKAAHPAKPLETPYGSQADVRQRFSPDAIELFGQITESYDLDGRRVPAGGFDMGVLARLSKEGSGPVRELAIDAAQVYWLNALDKAGGQDVQKAFQDQVKRWPQLIVEQIAKTAGNNDGENSPLDGAAAIIEGMMGNKPQEAVNKAWAVACIGNGKVNEVKEKIRLLANSGEQSGPAPPNAIDVMLETGPRLLGAISITNQTGSPLRHCLLFTRLEPDRQRIQAAATQEQLFGTLVLPQLGFSEETIAGSVEASQLRNIFNLQDKGVIAYVPEIPPRGTVTTLVSRSDQFLIGKEADVSLWCDDWVIEHQPARNWQQAKEVILQSYNQTPTPPGRVRGNPFPRGNN